MQALGCLLYYLAYGKLAFVGEAKLQVLNGDYTIPPRPQRAQPLKDLIRLMLTVQPAERPTIDTVLTTLGSLATNLKVDTPVAAAAPSSGVTRTAHPIPNPQAPQASQPVSSNPQDLISTPVSSSGQPAQRKQNCNCCLLLCPWFCCAASLFPAKEGNGPNASVGQLVVAPPLPCLSVVEGHSFCAPALSGKLCLLLCLLDLVATQLVLLIARRACTAIQEGI